MPPLTQNQITITNVTDITSGRRQLLRSRQLATSGVIILYSVTFNLATSGFSNINVAYANFSQNLNTSVSTGTFNALLESYAVDYQAPSMSGTTSTSATTSEPTLVTTDDDNGSGDSSKKQNLALILGLALGLGGGLCCIGLIAFFWFGGGCAGDDEEDYEKPKRKKHSSRSRDEEEGSSNKKERRNKKETDILMGESSNSRGGGGKGGDKVEMTDNPSRALKKSKSKSGRMSEDDEERPSGRVSTGEKQALNKTSRSKSGEKFTYPTDRKDKDKKSNTSAPNSPDNKSRTRPTKKTRSSENL